MSFFGSENGIGFGKYILFIWGIFVCGLVIRYCVNPMVFIIFEIEMYLYIC